MAEEIKNSDQNQEEYNLEQLFEQAEQLAGRLEEPDLPLEEAFAVYEQGMKVIRLCNQKIDLVEKKMMVMNGEGGLEPFPERE